MSSGHTGTEMSSCRQKLLFASAFVLWSGYLGRMRTPKAYHNAYSSRAQYGKAASVFVFDSTSSFVFDNCLWIRCSLNLILCSTLSFFPWRSYPLSTSILIWIQEIAFDWLITSSCKTRSLSNEVWLWWTSMYSNLEIPMHHLVGFISGSHIFGEMSDMSLQLCFH